MHGNGENNILTKLSDGFPCRADEIRRAVITNEALETNVMPRIGMEFEETQLVSMVCCSFKTQPGKSTLVGLLGYYPGWGQYASSVTDPI